MFMHVSKYPIARSGMWLWSLQSPYTLKSVNGFHSVSRVTSLWVILYPLAHVLDMLTTVRYPSASHSLFLSSRLYMVVDA